MLEPGDKVREREPFFLLPNEGPLVGTVVPYTDVAHDVIPNLWHGGDMYWVDYGREGVNTHGYGGDYWPYKESELVKVEDADV